LLYSDPANQFIFTEDNRERLIAAIHLFVRDTNTFVPMAQFVSLALGCTQGAAQQFLEKTSRKWVKNGVLLPPSDVNKKSECTRYGFLGVALMITQERADLLPIRIPDVNTIMKRWSGENPGVCWILFGSGGS
jgi:hypothetical protein